MTYFGRLYEFSKSWAWAGANLFWYKPVTLYSGIQGKGSNFQTASSKIVSGTLTSSQFQGWISWVVLCISFYVFPYRIANNV